MKGIKKYIVFIVVLYAAVSCSVEKNTATTRFYHGLTARYNIYFNGYESFKEGVRKVIDGYADDYAEIIRVFEYSDPKSPLICSSDMDRAIQKSSKLIRLKSITAKPETGRKKGKQPFDPDEAFLNRKEFNEWVDDAYLLTGKAQFYKHDFLQAESIFTYCINNANDDDIRKEATLWTARICCEKGDFQGALRVLNEFELADGSPRYLKKMYYTTFTDMFVRQKRYEEAVPYLEKGLETIRGKREKYRLTYLLAQLYQQAGDMDAAVETFNRVVRMNPPYDVEFSARISVAGAYTIDSGSSSSVRHELEKMLKNSKNEAYKDQIYYVLGKIAMQENNMDEAIAFFHKSASALSNNPNQKGRTYLALAEYYDEKDRLIRASAYYDSTMMFLTSKYPDYLVIKDKTLALDELAVHLKMIEEQDSLQRVVAMNERERNILIDKIIAKISEEETAQKTSASTDRYNLGEYYENERRVKSNIELEGKWYFYNQTALTFGRTEFKRRYGNRPNEDNWRRSDKAVVAVNSFTDDGENTEMTDKSNAKETKVADNKTREYYLRQLPVTDSLLAISNDKIAEACINAGKIFFEKFADVKNASKYFTMLVSRYPGHELESEALYLLYVVNKEVNGNKAEMYRQRILEKYSDTEFAKIISDPDYFKKKEAEKKLVEGIYETAYSHYTEEHFKEAVDLCEKALQEYPDDELAPKFMLLKAYCTARIAGERSFKEVLLAVVESWPESEEGVRAKEIIAFLNEKIPELKVEEDTEKARELYVKNTGEPHVFALIIENPSFNINLANFDVISYNIDNYTNNNYRTQGEVTNNGYIIVSVSGFKTMDEAFDYYRKFKISEVVRNPSSSKMYDFIIGKSNLEALNKDKNPERYLLFFRENYLQSQLRPKP